MTVEWTLLTGQDHLQLFDFTQACGTNARPAEAEEQGLKASESNSMIMGRRWGRAQWTGASFLYKAPLFKKPEQADVHQLLCPNQCISTRMQQLTLQYLQIA